MLDCPIPYSFRSDSIWYNNIMLLYWQCCYGLLYRNYGSKLHKWSEFNVIYKQWNIVMQGEFQWNGKLDFGNS